MIATFCDICTGDIHDYETCYLHPDGYDQDGLPCVRVVCAACESAS